MIPQFKYQGGNFTAGKRNDRFDFAYYINKPRYTKGLFGKHVGFGQIVEVVSIVKALVDVVRASVDIVIALERAGWRKSTIIDGDVFKMRCRRV